MKIYVSHPIRGIHQKDGMDEQAVMDKNNLMARIFGAALRVRFPQHEFYVPAENEEFVALAYKHRQLDETSILDVDCLIIDTKDGVIFYNHEGQYSKGMHTEKDHTLKTCKPYRTIGRLESVASLPELEEVLLKCK